MRNNFTRIERKLFVKDININNFICKDNSSCNFHGKCINSTTCECEAYYFTYLKENKKIDENFKQCNYIQIGKKNLFLVSFFFGPMAFDNLIMGNVLLAVLKLTIPMILILMGNFIFMIGRYKGNEYLQIFGKIFEFFSVVLIIIWWLIDLIFILLDIHKDYKNVLFYNDF